MGYMMDGLFGASPQDIQDQRAAQMAQAAQAYARQSPFERAAGSMYQAGGMLGDMGAKALGGVDTKMATAQAMNQAAQSADTSTPEGLIQYADKIKSVNPAMAAKAVAMARDMKAKEAAAALALRKEDRADKELQEVKIAGVTNRMQAERDRLAANIARWAADASNDSLSIEQRREAVKSINQTKVQIEQMDNEAKAKGTKLNPSYGGDASATIDFSKMKESDKWKVLKEQAADKAAIGAATAQTQDVSSIASKLLSHPGLDSITGWSALTNFAAAPSGDAKSALTLLETLKSKAATVGRALASESGKLGNMALGEWKIVAEDIANLDPKSKEFPDQVQRIVDKTTSMESRLRGNYEDLYSVYEGLNPALSASTLQPQQPTPNLTSAAMPQPMQQGPRHPFSGVSTPAQVKQLYQTDKITKEQANAILADMESRGIKVK